MSLIGLMDCNNFFVSCERLFRPDLAKKPVAVLSSNDGCIVARSQEVKDMGIPMGLPLFQAKQLVDTSSITFFSSNFTLYRDISTRIMQTLEEEVGKCDVYSIDEAFFGVSSEISKEEILSLREILMQKVGIPVSIGVATTKTLAKEASKIAKKNSGVAILTEADWFERAKDTPCNAIWGLGRATTTKLSAFGIDTVFQFMALERSFVRREFGVGGERIYSELVGTVVHPLGEHVHDEQKSITSSRSFASATNKLEDLESAIAYHIAHASKKLRERHLVCGRVFIEMRAGRHSDFAFRGGGAEIYLDIPCNNTQILTKVTLEKVKELYDEEVPYKKSGVTLSGLISEADVPVSLFEQKESASKVNTLDTVLDLVQNKFGFNALHSASIQQTHDRSSSRLRSQSYTTSWKDIPSVYAK